MKFRIFVVIIFFVSYFSWFIYLRGNWDFTFTLQIAWFACMGAGILTSKLLYDKFLLSGDPTFPLLSVFIVSFMLFAVLSPPTGSPISKGFELNKWTENPMLMLLGWYDWYLSIGALAYALVKPDKKSVIPPQ